MPQPMSTTGAVRPCSAASAAAYAGSLRTFHRTYPSTQREVKRILVDHLPAGNTFTNRGLRIDRFLIDGAKGTGFRHNAGTISLGHAEARNVNQVNNGSWAFYLAGSAEIENLVSTDGTPAYPLALGSNTNRIVSGDVARGTEGGILLGGFRADLGSLRERGRP